MANSCFRPAMSAMGWGANMDPVQNIRLATELTGFELDMYNYEELPAFKAKLAELKGEAIAEGVVAAPAEEHAAEPAPAVGIDPEAVEAAPAAMPGDTPVGPR